MIPKELSISATQNTTGGKAYTGLKWAKRKPKAMREKNSISRIMQLAM